MKKIIALLLFTGLFFSSCGPKRYKCGPYRKCQIEWKETQKIVSNKSYC
ncbi:hypothetical protein [Flavobacterium sp. J27]|nr:hypothetical protein [Flavobacterium sp. J27]